MSVDTKLILCVEDSELAVVGKVVMEALRGYVKDMIQKEPEVDIGLPKGYEYPRLQSYDFETFMFPFTTKVDRMLWMQLGCSGDEEELVGGRNYIVFSLGVWGDHVTIMLVLKAALQPLGDMYYLDNDCGGEWEKV